MNLNIENWEVFRLGDIFDIKKGKRLTAEDQTIGKTPYIGAIDSNNGIANYIGQEATHSGNTITLSYNGSVGEAFFQPSAFWATDDVNVLYFKKENGVEFNRYIALFICTILKKEKYRYCYGRKWVLDSMNETRIKLPTKNNAPDWEWIEKYIKSLHHKPISTNNNPKNIPQLDIQNWANFKIGNLFEVQLSKGDIKLDDMDEGPIPLVSSGESHNGIVGFIDVCGDGKAEIFKGNKITIDMFGNAFYQPNDFYAVSHGRVNILNPNFTLTKNIGLFITSIIKMEQYKYSYGRAVYSGVAADMEIFLPIQKQIDGTPLLNKEYKYSSEGYVPDWEWMDSYIKSLPYSDRI